MKISVFGAGYVGLVTSACLADVGNDVMCVDVDAGRVNDLRAGRVPIHEPGLEEIVRRNAAVGRLQFGTEAQAAVVFGEVMMIAVGTPPEQDGSADVSHVLAVARNIGRYMQKPCLIVDKSTVPVGTADRVRAAVADALAARGVDLCFSVVANPEFLKEGAAVADFMRPDRIIIGVENELSVGTMRALYAPFQRNHDRLMVMNTRSAEFTKYAANAMLAARISFMNELANIAEKLGADIEMVRKGIGSDPRIGYQFLYAGAGYGGSCFPKDVKALIRAARTEAGIEPRLISAVEAVNHEQRSLLARKVCQRFGERLEGRRFALWGLAFKPETDDMREAPSREIVRVLLERGAHVCAYDPVAMDKGRELFSGEPQVSFAERPYDALDGADALLIVTEWKEFRSPDFAEIRCRLKQPLIFDGRNLYEPAKMRELGFDYRSIGR